MARSFCQSPGPTGALHSFPTRRSSDLERRSTPGPRTRRRDRAVVELDELLGEREPESGPALPKQLVRSEEHTSELQSRRDLVCRLLLEKKKNRIVHPYRRASAQPALSR